MTSPPKPWESNLQNSSNILRSSNPNPVCRPLLRSTPTPPPRPTNAPVYGNSYMPYSSYGSLGSYGGMGSYGGIGSYGSYSMPYRSSMYNTYGSGYGTGYNSYGMYGMNGYPGSYNDAEARFIQYAEESSRNTFANVESIVRAFNSLAMMLDNTFFAMTSSFRAVLGVAENFGRLRTMFGHIWYSINVFRLITWLYRRLMQLLGIKVKSSATSIAWNQAANGTLPDSTPKGSNWPTLAFLGMLLSAPYIISKFLPKYEDKSDPANWKTPGIKAKAVFDFAAGASNELAINVNDEVTLAPTSIQEEMKLKNTGWAFAVCNGHSGLVPLNYLVISKSPYAPSINNNIPVPKEQNSTQKTHTKRVSFGENQIFENVDLEDYVTGKKTPVIDSKALNSSKKSLSKTKTDKVNDDVGESSQVSCNPSSEQSRETEINDGVEVRECKVDDNLTV